MGALSDTGRRPAPIYQFWRAAGGKLYPCHPTGTGVHIRSATHRNCLGRARCNACPWQRSIRHTVGHHSPPDEQQLQDSGDVLCSWAESWSTPRPKSQFSTAPSSIAASLGMVRSWSLVQAASISESEPQCELYLSRCVPLAPNHPESTRTEPCIWRPEVWCIRQVKELHTKLNVGLLCDWKVLEN